MKFNLHGRVIFPMLTILLEYWVRDLKAMHNDEVFHEKLRKILKIKAHNEKIPGMEDIKRKGYPLEVHNITTKSGYILSMHRIPHGLSSEGAEKRRPILVQHGLLQTSIHWMMNRGNNSLAYLLVDNGFDVWLGNNRGNTFSKRHISMSSSNFSYWDFSFHEMGTEDIPLMIDYILEKTNRTKLTYIGFSMGTTAFLIAMTMRPEYNAKVHVFIAMAPVAFVDHARNPILLLVNYFPEMAKVFEFMRKTFKITTFPEDSGPGTRLFSKIFPLYCTKDISAATLCSFLIFSVVGFDPGQLDLHQTPMILHGIASTAYKNIVHYAQLAESKRFQLFDYGKDNVDIYGKFLPPVYPLKRVTVPTSLLWSGNDFLSSVPDVAKLASLLPNVIDNYRVRLDDFSHYDFVYGLDVHALVYEHLMIILRKYDVDD